MSDNRTFHDGPSNESGITGGQENAFRCLILVEVSEFLNEQRSFNAAHEFA